MSSPPGLSFEYSRPSGESVGVGDVDAWELKASRRALGNLKTLLAGQPMLDLISDQIAQGDAYYKKLIAESNGRFEESRIDLKAKGITSTQFLEWFGEWIENMKTAEGTKQLYLNTIARSHPEHYALPASPGIIEVIGGHMCRMRILPDPHVPEFVMAYGDPSFKKLPAVGRLEDGEIFCYLLQELRDCNEGCDFRLRLLFPAASPRSLLDEHAEHLAVEFRQFIAMAFQSKQQSSSQK